MNSLIDRIVVSQQTLCAAIDGVPDAFTHVRPAAGGFAIAEHAWHLADFEEEGIAVRLRRTLTETNPQLADFRGDAIAKARRYIDRDVASARDRFAVARAANAALLRRASDSDWTRPAVQEQVGPVTLASLTAAVLQHDIAHANEIIELLHELKLPVPASLAALAAMEPLARSA